MKNVYVISLSLVSLVVFLCPLARQAQSAEDMRVIQVEARLSLQDLQAKAAAEEEDARREAARSREKITGDRSLLEQEVRRIEAEVADLEKTVAVLEAEEKNLEAKETVLTQTLTETDGMIRELVGVIRSHAKDMQTLIVGSLQTALAGSDNNTPLHDAELLETITEENRFPGMIEIAGMNEVLRRRLEDGGAVRLTRGPIVDRAGNTVDADILVIGTFTAAYRLGEEVGFLNYSPAGRKLFALSRLPAGADAEKLRLYMTGRDEAVPMDISRGAALNQLVHTPDLRRQLESGGPLVWPILAIFVIAFVLSPSLAF